MAKTEKTQKTPGARKTQKGNKLPAIQPRKQTLNPTPKGKKK